MPAPIANNEAGAAVRAKLNASIVASRPDNNLCGALGHSQLDQGLGNFGSAPSINIGFSIGSFPWWVNFLSKGQFIMDRQSWIGAVSGTNSQQMANGSQITSAVNSRAATIFCEMETNDRPAGFTLDDGTTATLGSAGTVTIPNVKAMLNALVAAGKFIILIVDSPRGSASVTGPRLAGTQLAYHRQYREWCINEAPKLWPGRVFAIDTWAFGANTVSGLAGDARDLFTRDGLHRATPYAPPIAKQAIGILQGLGVPARQVPVMGMLDAYDATLSKTGAVFPAARLSGTGSSAAANPANSGGVSYSGSAANQRSSGYGFAATAALQAGTLNVTLARNVVSPQTGGQADWFDVTLAGTTVATAGPVLSMSYTLQAADLANLVAGDKFSFFDEFEIDSGGTGLRGLNMNLVRTTPTMTETIQLGSADATTGVLDTILAAGPMAGYHDGSGVFATIDGTETSIILYWYWHLAESATINVRTRIRNPVGRKNLPIWS